MAKGFRLTFYSSNYFFFCGTFLLPLLIRDLSSTDITDLFYYLLLFYLLYLLLLFNYKSIKSVFIHFYLITMSKNYKEIRALPMCLFRDESLKSSTIEGQLFFPCLY
jgi:hypothetical protein